jgi:hypothetical protein
LQAENVNLRQSDGYAWVLTVSVAVLLAIAPHLATFAAYGTPEFLADADDIAYLAVARAPYYGENALRDPFSGQWEHVPSLYSWAQFVPLAKLARALDVPLILNGLLWRIIGGALFGGALFLLFRRMFAETKHPTKLALGASLICLADAGFIQGRSFVETTTLLKHLWHATTPFQKPDALAQYRVVTPLLNLPFLLLLVAALLPTTPRTIANALLGVAALGLCVLTYFYLWTAAVVGLSLYFGWLLIEAYFNSPRRAENLRRVRFVAIVLIGGMMLGGGQIIANAHTFADPSYKPILERLSKGFPLAPNDPVRRMYIVNVWLWAKLALGLIAILGWRMRGLRLLWCLTLAGYALANSALVTGLEFENFHWSIVHASMGEIMLLGIGGQLLDRCSCTDARRQKLLRLAMAMAMALVVIAFVWRPYEALRAPDSAKNSQVLRELKPLRQTLAALNPNCSLAGAPHAVNVALLYTQSAQLFQEPYTAHLSFIPDREVHERHALNGWLEGFDAQTYATTTTTQRFSGGLFTRPEWEADAVKKNRLGIFNELENPHGADALIERFRPCYLLLPADAPPPMRGGAWRLIGHSATWNLWERISGTDEKGETGEARW